MAAEKKVIVCGAGGFIGSHVVKRLKREGHYVVGVDLKPPSYSETAADKFYLKDLTQFNETLELFRGEAFDEVFQFAADMGGAGYINTGDHDDEVVWNSMAINLNVVKSCVLTGVKRVFYASSACVYPEHNQLEASGRRYSRYFGGGPLKTADWGSSFFLEKISEYQRS